MARHTASIPECSIPLLLCNFCVVSVFGGLKEIAKVMDVQRMLVVVTREVEIPDFERVARCERLPEFGCVNVLLI